jgi:hypothetical protein
MSGTWSRKKRRDTPFPDGKQPLEDKLEAFVRRYRTTYDGPDAARRAGFDDPATVWPELLARKDVQARLRFYRPGVDRPDRSREGMLEHLFARAFVNLSDLIWIDPVTGEATYDLRKATSPGSGAPTPQRTRRKCPITLLGFAPRALDMRQDIGAPSCTTRARLPHLHNPCITPKPAFCWPSTA